MFSDFLFDEIVLFIKNLKFLKYLWNLNIIQAYNFDLLQFLDAFPWDDRLYVEIGVPAAHLPAPG